MSEPILVVDGLYGRIAGQQVVEDVSFEVPASGVTALLGRNGVGKTSTIKSILGLIDRSGDVRLAGDRIDRLPTHRIVQRGVGYVPEDREVFGSLSVAENLRLAERDDTPRREFIQRLFPDIHARAAASRSRATTSRACRRTLSCVAASATCRRTETCSPA